MVFFKRLSRGSRSNSYVDDGYDSPNSRSDTKYDGRPSSSRHDPQFAKETQQLASAPEPAEKMYPRQQAPQEPYIVQQRPSGLGHSAMPMDTAPLTAGKIEPMPDLLTRAFQEAVRPYTDKIEVLESQLADLQAWVEQMEQQRAEVHAWIDKRGLRPGMFFIIITVTIASHAS